MAFAVRELIPQQLQVSQAIVSAPSPTQYVINVRRALVQIGAASLTSPLISLNNPLLLDVPVQLAELHELRAVGPQADLALGIEEASQLAGVLG